MTDQISDQVNTTEYTMTSKTRRSRLIDQRSLSSAQSRPTRQDRNKKDNHIKSANKASTESARRQNLLRGSAIVHHQCVCIAHSSAEKCVPPASPNDPRTRPSFSLPFPFSLLLQSSSTDPPHLQRKISPNPPPIVLPLAASPGSVGTMTPFLPSLWFGSRLFAMRPASFLWSAPFSRRDNPR